MQARDVLEQHHGVFVDRGCLFVSTTGLLLTGYVNCEVIYPFDEPVRDLCGQLNAPFLEEVEGFISPATGDIVLLREMMRQANDAGLQTVAVWADKHSDNTYHVERNGFAPAIRGRRVVVVNDRISQGGTTRKVIAEACRLGCDVLGVATLAGVTAASAEALDVPTVHALCTIDVQSFPDDAIPPEFQGQPIVVDEALGHGAEYQPNHPDYPGGYVKLLS